MFVGDVEEKNLPKTTTADLRLIMHCSVGKLKCMAVRYWLGYRHSGIPVVSKFLSILGTKTITLNTYLQCLRSLRLNNTPIAGNVVICFTMEPKQEQITSTVSAVRSAGGVGVIIGRNPSNLLGACSNDFPCIIVDNELGTELFYKVTQA